jgi:hypothetical protein
MAEWAEVVDANSGRTYYANRVTNATTWDMPEDYKYVMLQCPLYLSLSLSVLGNRPCGRVSIDPYNLPKSKTCDSVLFGCVCVMVIDFYRQYKAAQAAASAAPAPPTPGGGPELAQAQAQIAMLAQQLAAQGEEVKKWSAQYNAAQQQTASLSAQLQAAQQALAAAQANSGGNKANEEKLIAVRYISPERNRCDFDSRLNEAVCVFVWFVI